MFNQRTLSVLKRELKEKVLSRTFIFMTILLPVLMFGIMGLQTFLISYEGDEKVFVQLISESQELNDKLEEEFNKQSYIKDGSYSISFLTKKSEEIDEYLNIVKDKVISEEISGILFIPDSALNNKKVSYYSKTPKNRTVTRNLRWVVNNVLVQNYFIGKDISDEELTYAGMDVDITGFKVSKGDEIKEEGFGNLILAYIFGFMLYISLLMMGSMTMQSVIEEKNNRIVEVLLSSVSSKELMSGKILGASITGLLQMTIWLLPIMLIVSTTWFVLPPEFLIDISMMHILYLLVNFFIGLVTFIGLFATVGSIFENAQEAQSGMWPVMLLIMIPFFIALSMGRNPTNPIAEIASMMPFASIIVMPVKMTLVDVQLWQFIVSVIVNLLTIILIFPIAGKIYRVGILRTGKKPSWSEVIKWLKYKY